MTRKTECHIDTGTHSDSDIQTRGHIHGKEHNRHSDTDTVAHGQGNIIDAVTHRHSDTDTVTHGQGNIIDPVIHRHIGTVIHRYGNHTASDLHIDTGTTRHQTYT